MRFYKKEATDHQPPANAEYPCVVLSFDRWNDFGTRTQFDLYYWPVAGVPQSCGKVKILHVSGSSTQLADTFTELDESFCSLGQSVDYYRHLDSLGDGTKTAITTTLRDIVFQKDLAAPFIHLDTFRTSLIRFSEPKKLYEQGLVAFEFTTANTFLPEFSFTCRLMGASADHVVSFNFRDREPVPGRIIAFIGTNGTGKTRYLERLANAVVSATRRKTDNFVPDRPLFSRVIAISYSAFDEFRKPVTDTADAADTTDTKGTTDSTDSTDATAAADAAEAAKKVIRCGIHDANGMPKDLPTLVAEIRSNLVAANQSTRMDALAKSLREILPDPMVDTLTKPALSMAGYMFPDVSQLQLSSGQLVLLSILSSLAVQIQPDSLLLFDEPEMHLHPNAIGGLMRAVNTALTEFRSYAVMATHSPLILQQLPGRYVRVFRRIDSTPVVDPLPVESFAENLTAITEEIFHAAEGPTLYGEWFRQMLATKSPEEIGELFDGRLSFNAKTMVRSLACIKQAIPQTQ
jgi:energy-coupling factor transporter ATP-binding protein EcfA2